VPPGAGLGVELRDRLLYSFNIERIGSKSSLSIRQVPLPPDPLELAPALEVERPAIVHIPIAIRGPKHTPVLLAVRAVLANHELVVRRLPLPGKCFSLFALLVEAVQDLDNSCQIRLSDRRMSLHHYLLPRYGRGLRSVECFRSTLRSGSAHHDY